MIRLVFYNCQSQVVSGETGGWDVSGKGVVTTEVGGSGLWQKGELEEGDNIRCDIFSANKQW